MSDEKTLLNDSREKDRKKASDVMDFSAAFNDDYDEPEQELADADEPTVPVTSILKGLPFLKKKKEEQPSSKAEKTEKAEKAEKTESIRKSASEDEKVEKSSKPEPQKEEKKSKKKNKKNKDKQKNKDSAEASREKEQLHKGLADAIALAEEDDEPEYIEEAEPEKKARGFSLFGKKDYEADEDDEHEEIFIPLDESQVKTVDEPIILLDDFDDEGSDEPFVIVNKTEKTEEPVPAEDDEADEDDGMILSIGNQEPEQEIKPEPTEKTVLEKKRAFGFFRREKEDVSESTEAPVEKIESKADEATQVIEEIPPFEEVKEEVIEEIPPFEEAKEEVIEETPSFENEKRSRKKKRLNFVFPDENTDNAEAIVQEAPAPKQEAEQIPVKTEEQPKAEEKPKMEEQPKTEEPLREENAPEEKEQKPPKVKKEKPPKEKKEKPPKEKKEKPPKVKKEKPPKEKKQKKEKVTAEAVEPQEKSVQLMTAKDHLTFIFIILALLLTIIFVAVKFIPFGNGGTEDVNTVTEAGAEISEIQLQREGALGHCIQSDIENVFYMYSQEGSLAYYRCDNGRMIPLNATGSVQAVATLGQDDIPVKVDYIEEDGQLFGTGVFRAKDTEGSYLHSIAIFKLVNLPEGYEQDGKALLLATTNEDALSESCNVWTDSYVVDLETGKTTRFLSSDNNLFSTGYSILTNEGYASSNGKIPFLTTREYDAVTNKKDVYIKDGSKEVSLATDIAGSYIYVDGDAVCYLKSTDNGFNAIKNTNGNEAVMFSLRSDTSYMYFNEYLLDKYNGVLYNVKTGEQVTVSGYGMSNPELMTVSPDGKYLVVTGTVDNVLDYQIHIFDLKSNSSAKYIDNNFSQHKNLVFTDKSTFVYSAVEPDRGCEYVICDVSKAF